MEKKNLTEEEIDVETFHQALDIVKQNFRSHGIIVPDVNIIFGDNATPSYYSLGKAYQHNGRVFFPTSPVIDLSIPRDVHPDYLLPMLIYQLSHEYAHAYVSPYELRGSIRIINELLAAATSHHVLIESGYQWYELKERKGQVISPKKLYDFIKAREKTVYKDPREVYKKHGCYLGLVSPKINIWELLNEFKKALQAQSLRNELNLEWLYDLGFFNLLT